jgi:flagellin
MNRATVLVLILIIGSFTPAFGNVIVNAGFETGDFSSWITQAAPSGSNFGVGSFMPYAGLWEAYFGARDSAPDGIRQTIVTVPGAQYTLSFWLRNSQNGLNRFTVMFGGTTVVDMENVALFGFQQYSYQVTASSASTILQFGAYDNPGYFYLDDVALDIVPDASPEPATALLLGGALLALGIWRRNTR